MHIIAFITFSADMHKIPERIGADSDAPQITPALGPPLWNDCGAQEPGEGMDIEPDCDMTQPIRTRLHPRSVHQLVNLRNRKRWVATTAPG